MDPVEARRFYAKDIHMMINFISTQGSEKIAINLSKGTNVSEIADMIQSIRSLANQYLIAIDVKTFGKQIAPKDFAYQAVANRNVMEKNETTSDEERLLQQFKNQTSIRPTDSQKRAFQALAQKGLITNKMWPSSASLSYRITDKGKKVSTLGENYRLTAKGKAMIKEGFSGWHGSARKSINELNNARIVVRHKRTVNEEKRGARTRQIESIFIENAEGERFKFPTNNITAAKAMVKHVNEGGTPFDNFGQHIYGIMEELEQLKTFQRYNRKHDFVAEDVGGRIVERIGELRTTLRQISAPKGYPRHFEGFETEKQPLTELNDEKYTAIKNHAAKLFDGTITESLPYVINIIEAGNQMKEKQAVVINLVKHVKGMDSIAFSKQLDKNDPMGPNNLQFNDTATLVGNWLTWLANYVADDELSNKMMRAADVLHEVDDMFVKAAFSVVQKLLKKGSFGQVESAGRNPIHRSEMQGIVESMKKYTLRSIIEA